MKLLFFILFTFTLSSINGDRVNMKETKENYNVQDSVSILILLMRAF